MKHISTFLLIMLLAFGSGTLLAQGSGGDNQLDSHVLIANPGPANNGGAVGWGIFMNLIAGSHNVTITGMTTASTAAANQTFTVNFYTRSGNALGGPVGSGPGSSPDGWDSLGTFTVVQGTVASGVSLLFDTPVITISPGDTAGVAIVFNEVGPRYFGTGTPPYGTYVDSFLTLVTGDGRSNPFTTGGTFFSSRELVGEIHYDEFVPVELTSFNAFITGNNVSLSWVTATELNNSGFQVERKTTKTNWDNIGFVNGHGTVTQPQYYSFIDKDLKPGSYSYRLKQVDFDGSSKYFELSEVVKVGSARTFSLSQNYPNPFNPATIIHWEIPATGFVTLKVYDLLGREVATLVNEERQAGSYDVNFDGSKLPSGTYFYTLQTGSFVQTNKMLLLK